MIGDEWWIRYRFVDEAGAAHEAAVGTGYDAIHGAYESLPFGYRPVGPDALAIRYLAKRPERHLVTLPAGYVGVQAGRAVPECLSGPPP